MVRDFRSEVHNIVTKIILPERFNTQLVFAAHNSHGHGAISRLEKVIDRLFTCTGYKEQVRSFVSKCKGCVALKCTAKVARPMKNFDKETLDVKRIGQKILADEMTRTLPLSVPEGRLTRSNLPDNCNVKIFFATELLSRFLAPF